MITITNTPLDEVRRRMGIGVDEGEVFSDAELLQILTKWYSTSPLKIRLIKVEGSYYPEIKGTWYKMTYPTQSGVDYNEDTINGVVEVDLSTSGALDDTDIIKIATVYPVALWDALGDSFGAFASSTAKMTQMVSISPGASINIDTLAAELRKQARFYRERKWLR